MFSFSFVMLHYERVNIHEDDTRKLGYDNLILTPTSLPNMKF